MFKNEEEHRFFLTNFKSLFVLLTGKDLNNQPVEGLQPTKWWQRIVRLTTTPQRPNGIIGSPKLLSQRCCGCLHHACISQCSCPWCTTFCENLDHRHLASMQGWRKKPVAVIVPSSANAPATSSAECDKCGGDCHDPDGPWKKMSAGLIPFLTHMSRTRRMQGRMVLVWHEVDR